jgi:glycosyltransferase involved in cell wall biosynthesis
MLTCIVVPHYDHVAQFETLLPQLVAHGTPLIVVDDASPEESFQALQRLLDKHTEDSILIRHEMNLGKGAAVITGLRAARSSGCTHALQIDADGQHDVSAINRFREAAEQYPDRIICGEPVFFDDVSRLRFFARYITLAFCRLETLSTEIRDAMCGIRLYPIDAVIGIIDKSTPGRRMTFDPEILVRACWDGIRLLFIPVKVRYPDDGRSHFRYIRDNVEISWMHTRLITGMLLRVPMLLRHRRSRRGRPATR